MTGMVFPFKGNKQEIKAIIYKWMQHEVTVIENYTKIYVNFLENSLVYIDNTDFFYSAYNDPELWSELLIDLPQHDWVIFFECVDSCSSYSYLIYENNIEVRRVSQEEDEDLYQEGEPFACEGEWLDFTTYYEREYYVNGRCKIERITDPDVSIENIQENDDETYHKYYHLTAKNEPIYHHYLARSLLVEVINHYLGFDILDKNCDVVDKLKIDYTKIPALERIEKKAKSGDVIAQNELGKMYEQGHGVTQDYALALYWYQQASHFNDATGHLNIGLIYLQGLGVGKDASIALSWINKAVSQGDADALTVLGEMYEKGEGVEQRFDEAAKLYRQAAKQRNAVAPYRLGLMYEHGRGFEIDLKMAKRWYYQAAGNFNEDAQKRLDELNSSNDLNA